MFKCHNNEQIEIMNSIFSQNSKLNVNRTRSQNDFVRPHANSVHYGHDSLRYFGPRIWEIMPSEIKQCTNLSESKSKIKKWIPSDCPCRLCRNYIGGLGYI